MFKGSVFHIFGPILHRFANRNSLSTNSPENLYCREYCAQNRVSSKIWISKGVFSATKFCIFKGKGSRIQSAHSHQNVGRVQKTLSCVYNNTTPIAFALYTFFRIQNVKLVILTSSTNTFTYLLRVNYVSVTRFAEVMHSVNIQLIIIIHITLF